MEFTAVVERMREVFTTSDAPESERTAIESAITSSAELKAWLAAADARLASMLSSQVSFPEKTIADCTRESVRDAAKAKERADTLARVPGTQDPVSLTI